MPDEPLHIAHSEAAWVRARKVMPGGVSSPVRAFNAVGGAPRFIKEAHGCLIVDLDGNEYIDYVGSYGPLIVGHANDVVVAAVTKALGKGSTFGAPTECETRLAELIISALPGMEMVRFVNSGTEAVMSALRLARGATGRDRIVKCVGCYHGHSDALLVEAGSGALTHGVPSSPGVPEATTSATIPVQYNSLDDVRAALEKYPNQIACIVVEPIAGNMGLVLPEEGYLQGLRELCDQHGTLLLFDEVMTGFRVAWGGAQVKYNVKPDITCLGKIIGGGLPVGAYAASKELMERISPSGPIYQAGTLSGNPLAMSAGLATLELLQEEGCYKNLETLSAQLADGLSSAARRRNVPLTLNRAGSMICPFFTQTPNQPIRNHADATACDTERFKRFFHAMLNEGVYLPPSQFETWFVSTAHDEDAIDKTIIAVEKALAATGE